MLDGESKNVISAPKLSILLVPPTATDALVLLLAVSPSKILVLPLSNFIPHLKLPVVAVFKFATTKILLDVDDGVIEADKLKSP